MDISSKSINTQQNAGNLQCCASNASEPARCRRNRAISIHGRLNLHAPCNAHCRLHCRTVCPHPSTALAPNSSPVVEAYQQGSQLDKLDKPSSLASSVTAHFHRLTPGSIRPTSSVTSRLPQRTLLPPSISRLSLADIVRFSPFPSLTIPLFNGCLAYPAALPNTSALQTCPARQLPASGDARRRTCCCCHAINHTPAIPPSIPRKFPYVLHPRSTSPKYRLRPSFLH